MIKIPFEDAISKIKEKSGLSEEEINSRISQKTAQLSGLISKEGAAHIIANELGIKLFEDFSGKLQIKNILEGMRDVETVGRVQQVFETREFQAGERSGKVASLVIGDETGTIRIVLWGSQADATKEVKEDDIVKIIGGYVRVNQGRREVHLNDRSKLIINPQGEEVGEVKAKAQSFKRKKIKDLTESDIEVELLGTVVQAFDPRFFEICPQCGKRAKVGEGENIFLCEEHGEIKPHYSYVFNLVLDDGTETIRAVFFRNQMEKLLEMRSEDILQYKDEPEKFEDIKKGMLGSMVKVRGRVNKNAFFDRLEFISQDVDPRPSAEEELKRLEASKNDI
jgi:replication factor A1